MLKQLLPATLLTLVLTVLLGLGYPLFMTQLAGRLFPAQAHGSLVEKNGTVLGSALIGQNFTKPDYFHPRLSATTAPDPKRIKVKEAGSMAVWAKAWRHNTELAANATKTSRTIAAKGSG